jgi:hypothetical protein
MAPCRFIRLVVIKFIFNFTFGVQIFVNIYKSIIRPMLNFLDSDIFYRTTLGIFFYYLLLK